MKIWYTLANSKNVTYKMGFAQEMEKEEAEKLGREECTRLNLTYVGTFSEEDIHEKEMELRRGM